MNSVAAMARTSPVSNAMARPMPRAKSSAAAAVRIAAHGYPVAFRVEGEVCEGEEEEAWCGLAAA